VLIPTLANKNISVRLFGFRLRARFEIDIKSKNKPSYSQTRESLYKWEKNFFRSKIVTFRSKFCTFRTIFFDERFYVIQHVLLKGKQNSI